MRHSKINEKRSMMGRRSQEVQRNKRLEHIPTSRPPVSTLMLFIYTYNPFNGNEHIIEIRHEISNGNNRYNVYLDGDKWRNSWSRWRFVNWMFRQIDAVLAHPA